MMDPIVLTLISAVLQAAIQGLLERIVPRNNVTEFILGKFLPNHGKNKILFENLRNAMELVEKALRDDAVEKQLASQTNREWVERLTDAVNQTTDLLDEIYSKVLAKSRGSKSVDESALRKIIRKSKGKLEQMATRLKGIAEVKDVYGSKESSSQKESSRWESTSLVEESEVHGREEDKEKILSLLEEDFGQINEEKIPIIAIVGMAGIGKTTLARLLFNDSNVKSRFSLRVWVPVSENMDVLKVTKTLYEKVTDQTSDAKDLDALQRKLLEKLKDTRFLFVFDDVWNEDHSKWEELQKALKNGAPKSRVIVTTQSEKAALRMRASETYHLQPLSADACWLVFSKKAFEGPSSDAPPASSVASPTPEEILKKCGGLL